MLAAGLAPAQNQPDPGAREQQEPSYEETFVLSTQNGFGAYARAAGAYDFPGDSANGGISTGSKDAANRRALHTFGLYAEITGVYDSGLVLPAATQGPKPASIASYGTEAIFGANAVHRWQRGEWSVEYRGSYYEYTNAPAFDGLDQYLQLTFRDALLRHMDLDLKSTLGTTTITNGTFSYFPASALDRIGLPTDELFNTRTKYMQSRADLTWQVTGRLKLGLGGDGFVVRRDSPLLDGLSGYSARASASYRLTRHQTLSATYTNTYFDFQNAFGSGRLETGALGYSIALSRKWDLSALGGGVRVAMVGLTEVSLPPSITALTGNPFAVVTFHGVHYLPVAEMRLMRRLKQGFLSLEYASSVTPGNGYYLTSRQSSGMAAYSYLGGRGFEARFHAGYNELAALGQAFDKYSNVQGGMQVLYKLTNDAFLDLRYDYRHYDTGDLLLKSDANRMSLGVVFQLGDASLIAW